MSSTPRVVVAGTSSACGKTLITAGIIRALTEEGLDVQPFKVGPDYIDPSYHWLASGRPCGNLDTFLFREEHVLWLFNRRSRDADLAIVEGVRGLYEGIGAVGIRGSTYHVSEVLNAPIVLVVDTRSLTKSAAAVVLGYRRLENARIEGVILNNVRSELHYRKARRALRKYVPDVEVLGYVPRTETMKVEYRHLGLTPTPERRREMERRLEEISRLIADQLDLDLLLDIADRAGPVEEGERPWEVSPHRCRVAVALDEAFNFYYPENLEALEENGAKVLEFSPVKDEEVPPSADALYLGGGYPELFARELEEAEACRESIRELAESGAPVYAECGGMMYLCRELRYGGERYRWVGVLDASVEMTSRVQGLSYTVAEAVRDTPVTRQGEVFKGHEFHYSRLLSLKDAVFAYRILRGQGMSGREGIQPRGMPNVLGTYVHVHAASHPTFARNLAESAHEHRQGGQAVRH